MYKIAGICSLVLLSAISAGCLEDWGLITEKSLQSGRASSACSEVDYAISEFYLDSSQPVIGRAHDVVVKIEKTGECVKDALDVSFFENGKLVVKQKVLEPTELNEIIFSWIPAQDREYALGVELEIMDTYDDNNKEEVDVKALPLGNYYSTKSLEADILHKDGLNAQAVEIDRPLRIQSAWFYLKSAVEEAATATCSAIIYEGDEYPKDGLFKETASLTLTQNFDWQKIPLNASLSGNKYWLALSCDSDQVAWHFDTIIPFGSASDTAIFVEAEPQNTSSSWKTLPGQDYSFKLSAE
ncbi:MAG: hypothetical protein ACOYUZ_02735 [Patescibacteria group bacterium]